MSALGQKRTLGGHLAYVRFTPESGHWRADVGMSALCQQATCRADLTRLTAKGPRVRGRAIRSARPLTHQLVRLWQLRRQLRRRDSELCSRFWYDQVIAGPLVNSQFVDRSAWASFAVMNAYRTRQDRARYS